MKLATKQARAQARAAKQKVVELISQQIQLKKAELHSI